MWRLERNRKRNKTGRELEMLTYGWRKEGWVIWKERERERERKTEIERE